MISQSIFALVVLTLAYVEGTPFGATSTSCRCMAPRHVFTMAAKSASPYRVDIQKQGNSTEVTITGKQIIQGFMLQARVNKKPAGTFTVNDSFGRILPCPDEKGTNGPNSVTHSQINSVKSVTYVWTAPPGTSGRVQFFATVAKNFANYWVKIPSEYVDF